MEKEVSAELYESLVRVYPLRTICEVLREIFWGTEDPAIRMKVIDAMIMAKKMSAKLSENWEILHPSEKKKWDADMWEKNPFYEQACRDDVRKG